jgi:antitoxin CptB
LDQMNEEELVNYDLLLAENDHDLYSWVTGSAEAPAEFVPMIDQIVAGLQVPRG